MKGPQTSLPDSAIRRDHRAPWQANPFGKQGLAALWHELHRKHGNTREAKRLERTLPAQNNRKETKR